MPFIIQASNLTEIPKSWVLIPPKKLKEYRIGFTARHQKLKNNNPREPKLNFMTDITNSLKLNMVFFNRLIQQANVSHYLTAHYICEPAIKNYQNLNIAICIKEKGTAPNGKDKIIGEIYDVDGNILTHTEFCGLRKNYNERRDFIATYSNEFELDREGRAHEITEEMQGIIKRIARKADYMYVYFILDDFPDGKNHISIAFSDDVINFENPGFVLYDDAYDHGSACCPIG